jgi:uncharacterized membrane protein YqaE (UPF0057 family)
MNLKSGFLTSEFWGMVMTTIVLPYLSVYLKGGVNPWTTGITIAGAIAFAALRTWLKINNIPEPTVPAAPNA